MYAYPVFPRQLATSTRLLMTPSAEAKRLENVESGRAKPKEGVLAEAGSFVSTNGGDPSDQFLELAHCKLQFRKYQGQRFRWLLENSLGYAVYLVLSISKETAQKKNLSENKQLFLQYTSHIREMAEEVDKYERKQEMQAEARATGDQGCLMVEFGDFQSRSMKDVYEDQSKKAQALIRYLVKGIVHFEIKIWYLSAYPKGIQDVGVFFSSVDPILMFLGQTVLVCQSYNGRYRSLSL